MSLFPGSFYTNDLFSFPSIFRFFDEIDSYPRFAYPSSFISQAGTFWPKFDIKERQGAYELHGEVPGVDQKDIEIEFTSASTLTISGRTEHSYSRKCPPRGFIEGEALDDENQTKALQIRPKEDKVDLSEKYLVRERSAGEFFRSFAFPSRVEQDEVKATLKNGILSILVPKASNSENRRAIKIE